MMFNDIALAAHHSFGKGLTGIKLKCVTFSYSIETPGKFMSAVVSFKIDILKIKF